MGSGRFCVPSKVCERRNGAPVLPAQVDHEFCMEGDSSTKEIEMDLETARACERSDPLRRVDWRWRYAQALVGAGRRISRRRDDPAVIDVVRYLRALAQCHGTRECEVVRRRWPAISAANQLVEVGGERLWEVQARVLAGQSDAEIAKRC